MESTPAWQRQQGFGLRSSTLFLLGLLAVLLVWAGSVQTADTALQTLGFSCCQHRLARASQLALTHVRSRLQCARDCAKMAACQVAQTRGDKSGGFVECRLLTNVTSSSDCSKWTEEISTRAMVKRNSICGFGGVRMSGTCHCPPHIYGSSCENFIEGCFAGGHFGESSNGWGWIKPSTFSEPMRVFCNFRYGVVGVLRRFSRVKAPPVLFNRSWEDYKHGFGDDVTSWLGLDKVFRLLQAFPFSMEFFIELPEGPLRGVYYNFRLGNESTNYQLSFSGTWGFDGKLASRGVPRRFCTYDRDCNNCSKQHQGAGWWYGPNCETGGATYPQSNLWWTKVDGVTRVTPREISFHLAHVP